VTPSKEELQKLVPVEPLQFRRFQCNGGGGSRQSFQHGHFADELAGTAMRQNDRRLNVTFDDGDISFLEQVNRIPRLTFPADDFPRIATDVRQGGESGQVKEIF